MRPWLALLLVLAPSVAVAQCSPSSAPVGSIGCQPSLAPPQAGDLIPVWRSSIFPNSFGQVPVEQLPLAAGGVTCSGSPTSSFASVNGIVTHC